MLACDYWRSILFKKAVRTIGIIGKKNGRQKNFGKKQELLNMNFFRAAYDTRRPRSHVLQLADAQQAVIA